MPERTQARRRAHAHWIVLPIVIVTAAYLWFISAGTWISWPKTSIYNYYGNLAAAFSKGNLHLDDAPSRDLLALPDPYRKGARKGISYIWDATLYNGRYYVYWGPVPALVLLPAQVAVDLRELADIYLVFLFVAALYGAICLLLIRIWRQSFGELPRWTLSLGLMVAGLAPPLAWMLNRPEVYEAAIAAAQFFLFGGICWCFAALKSDDTSVWRLAAGSAFWGLAIGSRSNQALPVLLLLASTTLWLLGTRAWRHRVRLKVGALAALFLPVAACVGALLLYNHARFGAILEFGYRYQLTLLEIPKHHSDLFSTAYVVPNLRNYFLNPFTVTEGFPFIKPQYGVSDLGSPFAFPGIYFSEAVTGLLFTFPFMLVPLAPLLANIRSRPAAPTVRGARTAHEGALAWLWPSLAGVLIVELSMLLAFFFATERYLGDVVPALALVSVLGFWQGFRRLKHTPNFRLVWSASAILLAAVTILTSSLLAISSYQERFQNENPALMEHINAAFFR
jgi:hypothetical protein